MKSPTKQNGITLLGLGPGAPELLSTKAVNWLNTVSEIYVKVTDHPALSAGAVDLVVKTFDDINADSQLLGTVKRKIVSRILDIADKGESVTYAVPGNPLIDDPACQAIYRQAQTRAIPVNVIQGIGILDTYMMALGRKASKSITVISTSELKRLLIPSFSPMIPALILNDSTEDEVKEIKKMLLSTYPESHTVSVIKETGLSEYQAAELPMGGLDQLDVFRKGAALYIPPIGDYASFESFQQVIARLRAPDGCPWDREQTHQTLRSSLLEETYEALSALDSNDSESLKEELGDLLLQILMHAQIATETGEFTMVDVIQGISRKLVYRHPHVFGDEKAESTEIVLQNWEKLKEKERKNNHKKGKNGMLDGVPKDYPALSQAQEYQKRVRRVGFDWSDIEGVLDKLEEEIREVQDAETQEEKSAEMGDLLFSVVNLARWYGVDAESALRGTNLKFKRRFQYVEQRAKEKGLSLSEMTLEEMDVFWDEAKELED